MVSFDIYDSRFTVIYFILLMTVYCQCHHFRCRNCCSFAVKIGLLVQRTTDNFNSVKFKVCFIFLVISVTPILNPHK